MSSKWHQKKEKIAKEAFERELQNREDESDKIKNQASAAAMGEGDDELFEKKLTKEEKKALAKKKREEKKAKKGGKKGKEDGGTDSNETMAALEAAKAAMSGSNGSQGDADGGAKIIRSAAEEAAAEALAEQGTICTFAASRKGVDARSRDVNIQSFTLLHKGSVMLDETEIVLNHGNRYGLIGRNGCGKSTLMKVLGARACPVPAGIDIFHLKEEIQASNEITAIQAVMSVDEARAKLEADAESLNAALAALAEVSDDDALSEKMEEEGTLEEQQEQIMEALNAIYERLDALDADTAEARARNILRGLGFTHQMQEKVTADFSGGWRMRVSLARALFIQPTLLLLDEPTNHLDMEAVIWLEEYLSKWDKILLLISHSQDFLNNVCTHMIHFTNRRKLVSYDGNYDQFIKTKAEKEENQMKQYNWEQDQIKSMKEYIARFGHGTAKNAKQAQSKEKVLEKMVRAGLTEKPEVEKPMNFKFPDPGHLPPPVLAFRDVSFAYPNCEPLYSNVNFGVDLDSRVALVGPNGAGKTTLVKLMSGELQPSLGDIRPHGHLKLGRFTQHFVDVLDLSLTPLEFFGREYPNDTREDLRKYLGRFGISGKMQSQRMEELSDGQKSRVVFAKLGRDVPHILLLDEPTNHLDMESIDALADAVNAYNGGLVLVSHDMRLISQVAKEIWICDDKTVKPYRGDIQNFKMEMRAQLGMESSQKASQLRGDASVMKNEQENKKKPTTTKKSPGISVELPKSSSSTKSEKKRTETHVKKVIPPPELPRTAIAAPAPKSLPKAKETANGGSAWDEDDWESQANDNDEKVNPPKPAPKHSSSPLPGSGGRYIPPHLRKKMQQEQQ